jgi:hypothetical protein
MDICKFDANTEFQQMKYTGTSGLDLPVRPCLYYTNSMLYTVFQKLVFTSPPGIFGMNLRFTTSYSTPYTGYGWQAAWTAVPDETPVPEGTDLKGDL